MISPTLLGAGVAFYDSQRAHGAHDRTARHAAVFYMRRKDQDVGDAMPYYEALANALADRAQNRILDARRAIEQLTGRTDND